MRNKLSKGCKSTKNNIVEKSTALRRTKKIKFLPKNFFFKKYRKFHHVQTLMSALTIQITVMKMHPVQTMLVPLRVPVILATVVTALHVPILTNVQPTLTIAASTAHVQTQLVRSHALVIQGI